MKVTIRLKIVFLGAILSLFVTIIATIASYFIYLSSSKDNYQDSIINVLDGLEDDINGNSDLSTFIINCEKRINDIYNSNPDDPEFESFEDKENYYREKYAFLYNRSGSLGLSLDDLKLRNGFLTFQNKLIDAETYARVNSIYVAYYDEERGRILYMVDSRHGDSGVEYYLPGSYHVLTNDDYEYVNDKNMNFKHIQGTENVYKEIKLNDADGNYVTTVYLFVEYDETNVINNAKMFLLYIVIILVSTAFIITILYAVISHLLISKNISKINNSTKLFTNNLINSDRKNELQLIDAEVKSRDELEELSNNINSMESEILTYIKRIEEANRLEEKINAELHVASKIQLESLPESVLENDALRIDSFISSAKEVGGDFYDYFYLDSDRLAIIISDVSGKGVPAALFMMKSKELIKSKLLSDVELEKAFFDINNELLINNEEGLFVTSLVMVINLKTLECNIINAGHEKPLLVRNGVAERINIESNFILSGMDDFEYKKESIQLEKGDHLLLHTDGLNESINDNREEFGYDRIVKVLSETSDSKEYINNLNKALNEFTQSKEQFDDVTMVSINIKNDDELIVRCDNPSFDSIEEVTTKFMEHYKHLNKDLIGKVAIIIDDVINNYVSYEDLTTLKIEVRFRDESDKFHILFINNGVEFNPLNVNNKKREEYSDDAPIGGLGILIIKEMTDYIDYKREDGLNKFSMYLKKNK